MMRTAIHTVILAASAALLLSACGGPCSDDPADHACEGGGSGPTYTPPPATPTPTPTPTDFFSTAGVNASAANGQIVLAWVTEGYGGSRTVYCGGAVVSNGAFALTSPGLVLNAGLDYNVAWLVNNDGNAYYDVDHAEAVYSTWFTATTGSNLQTLDLATAVPDSYPAWANGQGCP